MLMIASHNTDSVQQAKSKLKELKISDNRVRFA
jgi:hypothetical protein